jgi:hypothetical protein
MCVGPQEAIELHMIEALQPWMHGSVDRGETERRLQYAGKTGAFLVRMKGPTGRVFVFSILSDSAKVSAWLSARLRLLQVSTARTIWVGGAPTSMD